MEKALTLHSALINTGITLQTEPTGKIFTVEEYPQLLTNLPIGLDGIDPIELEKDNRWHPQTLKKMIEEVLSHKNYSANEINYSDNVSNTATLCGIPDYDKVLEKIISYDHEAPGLAGGDRRLKFCHALYEEKRLKLFSLGQALTLFNELLKTQLFKKSSGKKFLIFLKGADYCFVSMYRSDNSGRYKFDFIPTPYGYSPNLLSFDRNGHFIIS